MKTLAHLWLDLFGGKLQPFVIGWLTIWVLSIIVWKVTIPSILSNVMITIITVGLVWNMIFFQIIRKEIQNSKRNSN